MDRYKNMSISYGGTERRHWQSRYRAEVAEQISEEEGNIELNQTLNRLKGPTDFVQLRNDIEAWRARVYTTCILQNMILSRIANPR